MTHAPIFSGDGYHCTRCNLSWDQGDPQPGDCVGGAVTPLGPPPHARPRWIGEQLTQVANALAAGTHRELDRPIKTPVDTL